jgi:lysozyme family protein
MAEFTQALPRTLQYEGTELFIDPVNNERSRYGITEKTLVAIRYDITDPNLLTIQQVNDIYSRLYWGLNKLAQVNSQLVANKIFDMAVNMGNFASIKLVQAAINSIGGQCVIDGMMGPHTLICLNEVVRVKGEVAFLEELRLKCVSYYKSIAVGSKAKYLAGWLKRANDVGLGEIDAKAFNSLRDGAKDKVVKG